MKNILIRTDGGKDIGMGHVMRCITLAKELKRNNINALFVCCNKSPEYIVEKNGFEIIYLNSNKKNLDDSELPELIHIINKMNAKLCIIDSYFATSYYYSQLQKHIPVAVVDGNSKCKSEVSLIINPNIGIDKSLYYENGIESSEILSGIDYSFVRSLFYEKRRENLNDKVKNILFTVGGSDSYDVTSKIINEIINRKNVFDYIEFYIIIGPYFNNDIVEELKQKCKNNIHICTDILDLSELMCNMDLIVTAGGTTVFEVMAEAIPSVVFAIAENQYDAGRLTRYINWFGDIRNDKLDEIDMNKLKLMVDYIENIIINFEDQKEKVSLIKKEFDGKGVKRIASSIKKYI